MDSLVSRMRTRAYYRGEAGLRAGAPTRGEADEAVTRATAGRAGIERVWRPSTSVRLARIGAVSATRAASASARSLSLRARGRSPRGRRARRASPRRPRRETESPAAGRHAEIACELAELRGGGGPERVEAAYPGKTLSSARSSLAGWARTIVPSSSAHASNRTGVRRCSWSACGSIACTSAHAPTLRHTSSSWSWLEPSKIASTGAARRSRAKGRSSISERAPSTVPASRTQSSARRGATSFARLVHARAP